VDALLLALSEGRQKPRCGARAAASAIGNGWNKRGSVRCNRPVSG
jgi:hypothetical protein